MPSYKAGNGEYKDICFPVTKEFREQLSNAVIDAYHQALAQSQSQNQQKAEDTPPFEQAPEQGSGMRMAGL
jgi:stage V sporulation protein G